MLPGKITCKSCDHYNKEKLRGFFCAAFPDGIPYSIICGGPKESCNGEFKYSGPEPVKKKAASRPRKRPSPIAATANPQFKQDMSILQPHKVFPHRIGGIGAIIGDIVGSPYEFDHNNIKTEDFPCFQTGRTLPMTPC